MRLTRRRYLTLMGTGVCGAVETPVLDEWHRIARETDGTLGAAALHISSMRRISLRGDDRFPLASVCKLPIAIHILALADEGKLSLNDEIEIPVYDVVPGVSEVAERWPRQKRFPLGELLRLMVARSDNTAVQTLFRIGGGAVAMAERFRQWDVGGMRIDRSERCCALDAEGVENIPPVSQWTPDMLDKLTAPIPLPERLAAMQRFIRDPRDTATPNSTVELLSKAFRGEVLSEGLTQHLIEILEATTTGSGRIKGLLPNGTVVAHKTGTTATVMDPNGSTNDVGVITLPGEAGQLALSVYVKGSTADRAAR